MIDARRRLAGQARTMFETHLLGLYRWEDVRLDKAEPRPVPLDRPPGWKWPRLLEDRERVVVRFGEFVLDVRSSEDDGAGALGLVKLMYQGGVRAEGPLDAVVWDNIGGIIRELSK